LHIYIYFLVIFMYALQLLRMYIRIYIFGAYINLHFLSTIVHREELSWQKVK